MHEGKASQKARSLLSFKHLSGLNIVSPPFSSLFVSALIPPSLAILSSHLALFKLLFAACHYQINC